MKDFIQILKKRGMFHAATAGTEAQLAKEKTAAYIGFDPTAPSLHIGNLATIMLLKHLQLAGHRPVIVLGGATGMIGDPSFKAAERKLLDIDTLRHNQACIEKQLRRFLDFSGDNGALLVNNYDWFKDISFLDFLRDVGKYISVNYMMAKDSVKTRLTTGISYTEFAYSLLQAHDFYHLYTTHNVKMQMGGADQWGNITAGTELIRKKAQGAACGLTTPLIVKADGTKFGKTESGNVWLAPSMTSPYQFYQFWINTSDEDAEMLVKRMTLYPLEEIEGIIAEHRLAPHKRILQKALAKGVTCFVHSAETYQQVVKASEILFGAGPSEALRTLDEKLFLNMLAGVPKVTIDQNHTDSLTSLLSYGTHSRIFSSKRIAREVITAGGIRLNKVQLRDPNTLPSLDWLFGKYILVQKGKKHFFIIEKQG